MNSNRKQASTNNSFRRVVSLFITVIWLATLLQPCVMASVVDSNPSKMETHHTSDSDDHSSHQNHGTDSIEKKCSHCDASGGDDNHCKPENDKICDNEDSYAYSERIKPADLEKFHDQYRSLNLLCNSDDLIQIGQLVASDIGKSPPPFQGPNLADLYQVYLK